MSLKKCNVFFNFLFFVLIPLKLDFFPEFSNSRRKRYIQQSRISSPLKQISRAFFCIPWKKTKPYNS